MYYGYYIRFLDDCFNNNVFLCWCLKTLSRIKNYSIINFQERFFFVEMGYCLYYNWFRVYIF